MNATGPLPKWMLLALCLAALWAGSLWVDRWQSRQSGRDSRLNPPVLVQLDSLRPNRGVDLGLRGRWRMLRPDGVVLEQGVDFLGRLKLDHGHLKIGVFRPELSHVVLETDGDVAIRLNQRWYRGRLHLLAELQEDRSRQLVLRLELPLEDYVLGVVSGEMETSSPNADAALQVQAVAARTYALWKLGQVERPYLLDSTYDQRFESADFETESAVRAVQATVGQILVYDGEILAAYYHADCGGHTSAAYPLGFRRRPYPPLRGVADPLCRDPFGWEKIVPAETLDAWAKQFGLGAYLETVHLYRRGDPGQRCAAVQLIGANGAPENFLGERFRSLTGSRSVRIHEMRCREDGALWLRGSGYGHGIGMCQNGALLRSRAGESFQDILFHYYPGAELASIASLVSPIP
ncbi:MAG: SpoIID/LytB domain-containing protein [Planctomycetota bacterium]|nr:MAG: SpoIID/LytB domain-containing protein [Planctomycetota bacterium]